MTINKKINKLAFSVILIIILLVVLTSCVGKNKSVAAIVEGVEISENSITEYINQTRQTNNLQDDNQWKEYLSSKNINEQQFRENIVDIFIDKEVNRQLAKKYNIEITQSEIENEISIAKAAYSSEKDFEESLEKINSNIDKYKQSIEDDLLDVKIKNKLIENVDVNTNSLSKLIFTYGDKLNGSKGYYQLIFKNEEINKAYEIKKQIDSKNLSFEDATTLVTSEDKEGINFNYVIYDCLIQNPEACSQAIKNMSVGQVSDLIKTDNYTYIFKVVDNVVCPSPLKTFSDLPDFTRKNLENYAKIADRQSIAQQEYDKEKAKLNIVKF